MEQVGEAISGSLSAAYLPQREMSEGEILTRAREAWIATHNPGRWLARRMRSGRCDNRLRSIISALRDVARPMTLIVADRDEATCALIMKTTPYLMQLPEEQREAAVNAIMTGIRIGRRG